MTGVGSQRHRGKKNLYIVMCVETAFYNGLLKEIYKGIISDRKTRKKT
jgi:hypothetical protein